MLSAPLLSTRMTRSAFAAAMANRVAMNPGGENSGPLVYSVRVIVPSDFRIHPGNITNPAFKTSALQSGSLSRIEIYAAGHQGASKAFELLSKAREVEVKFSDEANGPWSILRIRLDD